MQWAKSAQLPKYGHVSNAFAPHGANVPVIRPIQEVDTERTLREVIGS
jgi:hypothetical protein